jgi:hypothetical protein
MKPEVLQKIKKEINSVTALSIVNITFSAIILALGIVLIVNNVFQLIEESSLILSSIVYIIIGLAMALIGFWWIISSASIMDFITDIQWQNEKKKQILSDDQITSQIIKMISYYRENNQKIKRMIFISQVGGCIFIINGIISTIDLFFSLQSTFDLTKNIMPISSIFIMFAWGASSLYIPRFIRKYASIWDNRIKQSIKAEEIIKQEMESQ